MQRSAIYAVAAGAIAAVVLTLSATQLARSQVSVAANYAGVGSSQANESSIAWFHEPNSRMVVACATVRTSSGAPAKIECAKAQLPAP